MFGQAEHRDAQSREETGCEDVREDGAVHLRMEGIIKRFGPTLANDRIDFQVRQGEIHALLGENGAGKTTLMNILFGLYQADEGTIYVRGEKVDIRSPHDAIEAGIGMVHQHFLLVPPFTVTENVILGLPSPKGLALDIRSAERRIQELSEEYGLEVDPRARVWQLTVGAQQRVEIMKAFYRGADLLILDEPTAVLTPQEVEEFFVFLRKMNESGATIIFITHKLDEVMTVSDRVTVLRDGRVIDTLETSETNPRKLGKMMVGREVFLEFDRPPAQPGRETLRIENLKVRNDRGLEALRGVSLCVREGELLGVAGVDGNGQQELAEAIFSLREIEGGDIYIGGRKTTNAPTREILCAEAAYIPADRLRAGLVPDFTIAENCILGYHDGSPFARSMLRLDRPGWLQNLRAIDSHARDLVKAFDIRTVGHTMRTRTLSGGNLQKLVLARALSCNPKLLVALNPTRGLDVGSTEFIRQRLLLQREQGRAVLLISVDLDEIMALCDRIAVLHRGQIMGIVSRDEANVEEIGLMMAGTLRQNLLQETGV
jgi:ABC-type uncharacterized transport system ATPase subunit